MKRVYLLRHAKSSWSEKGLRDHERPLNKRGRRAAPVMGAYMSRKNFRPEGILCSSAVRTRETLDLVHPHLGRAVPVRVERRLYRAAAPQLLSYARGLPAEWDSVLFIGHNPGLEDLVGLLRDPNTSDHDVPGKFPTAALAVFDLPITEWSRADAQMGRLVEVAVPRDLQD